MDFTTLARVREVLGATSSDTSNDALFGQLITAVSSQLEGSLRRWAQSSSRTETYETGQANRLIQLNAAPVDMNTAPVVKISPTFDFSTSTALTINVDYTLNPTLGLLRILNTYYAIHRFGGGPPIHPLMVQVTYTAGLAASTAALIANYPDLAQACDMQVTYMYQRRLSVGGNQTLGTSGQTFTADYGIVRGAEQILSRYRRRVW